MKIATGEISDYATGFVLPEETTVHQIQVGNGIGSLILNFRSLSDDDIKATLYNPLGVETWHTTSYNADQIKSRVVDFPMPGTWRVEVLGSDVKESGRYELNWTQLIGIQSLPQSGDPSLLMPDSDSVGFVSDGEAETLRFNVPAGSVHLTLGFASLSNDGIKFVLQNPAGEDVWHSTSYGSDQTKSNSIVFPMPGEWKVEVHGADVTRSGYYSCWIDLIEGPFLLIQTVQAQSSLIFSDALAGYVFQDGSEEHLLNVPAGTSNLHLEARSLSDDDVKVVLSNPMGEEVWHSTSYSSDQVKSKSVTNPISGTWTIEAFGSGVKYSGYYLIQASMKPAGLLDTASTVQMDGMVTEGQIDEHTILIPEKVGHLLLLVDPGDIDIEFKLLNPSGIEAGSTSSGMLEVIRPLPGTWTVKAIGKSEDSGAYALRVWLIPTGGGVP